MDNKINNKDPEAVESEALLIQEPAIELPELENGAGVNSNKLHNVGLREDEEEEAENEEEGEEENVPRTPAGHNFEDVISAMGPPGRYQILRCIVLSAYMINAVFINMNYVFIGLEPPFSCSPVNETKLFQSEYSAIVNETNTTAAYNYNHYQTVYEDCEIRITSNSSRTLQDVKTLNCYDGYTYTGGKHVSIVTEWDLVCDKRGVSEMAQAFMSFGWFLGLFIASAASDKFGRKKTITIAAALCSITEISCAFAPSIYVMIGLRVFSGFFGSGINAVIFVLGAELLVSKDRETFGVYFGVMWSIFAMVLCAIAYFFHGESWRDLQLCLGIISLSLVVLIFFIDESASWLYSKGEYKKAAKIIKKACKTNGIDFDTVEPTWDKLCDQGVKHDSDKKAAKDYNALDLFRDNKLRTYVLIACFTCFTNDLSYFGMYLSASTLAGNLYLNTTIMAILELPGNAWMFFMLKYRGRRLVAIFFMSLGAVCLLVSTCLSTLVVNDTQHTDNTSTAFFLFGRLAISNSYTLMYIYIPELFPTTIRSSATGISLSGGCLGGMLSPYLMPLYSFARWAPGTCLICALTISSLLVLKLPETQGKQLVSNIEGEAGKNNSSE